jgi:hypothetical protein
MHKDFAKAPHISVTLDNSVLLLEQTTQNSEGNGTLTLQVVFSSSYAYVLYAYSLQLVVSSYQLQLSAYLSVLFNRIRALPGCKFCCTHVT